MTGSTEASRSEQGPASPLDDGWRADSEAVQQRALPGGSVVVSCPAPYGSGGLGRHLEEILEALRREGRPGSAICQPLADGRHGVPGVAELARLGAPLVRLSPAWRMWLSSVRFDADAARRLPAAEHLIAFNGTAVAQFRAARPAGYQSLSLMSANSHMRRVIHQHDLAYRAHPIERPWATRLLARNLAEYARADRIYVASRYIRESFLEAGTPERKLESFPLTPGPRFRPVGSPPAVDTFDVVYSGSLIVHKGVPLLIDAFRRLEHRDMRLVLVGGWKTRSMRQHIERSRREDPRILVSPGDPLPHLHRARLCVHPAYEDGFGYAPAEALACGVPVIVSEDTGMKELIERDRDGLVLPTGDADALAQAIDAAYRREIFGG